MSERNSQEEPTIERSLIVLTDSECKRLIAKGITRHTLVIKTLKVGKIFIGRGSTNAYILEELTDKEFKKAHYVAGQVTGDKKTLHRLSALKSEKRLPEVFLENGDVKNITEGTLQIFTPNDLIIKGGNVLGLDGIAGIYAAHPEGGTVGRIIPVATARGIPVIIPISLNKLVTEDVWELAQVMGNQTIKKEFTMGLPIGIIPLVGDVFTEIDALFLLYPDLDVYHMGAGGVGNGAASQHFMLEGPVEEIQRAYNEIKELIKNEEGYTPDLD